MRHIIIVVVNSREYPVSGPRAVTGNSVQQRKAVGERVPDVASGEPCASQEYARPNFQVTADVASGIWCAVNPEQLSVVGVGTSQKGVRVFRKFLERPHGDVKRRHEEQRDKFLHGELRTLYPLSYAICGPWR